MNDIFGYKITEVIHEGGKSIIYRGTKVESEEAVILKVLKAEYPSFKDIAQLKNEYEIIKDIDIDGVVKPYALDKYHHGLVLILEDFGGKSLTEAIASNRMSLTTFLKIAIRLTETLGEIHQNNIIHNDIKPSNVIVDMATNQVKIIDFGLASQLPQRNQTVNHPGGLEGTLAYMSPEQTGRMNRTIDYRTDFYSLGVTFYEMLTGSLPFQAADPMEWVHAHIAKPPPPPQVLNQDLPSAISDIVLKLLAKTAEERYQSAHGLKADLVACLTQLHTYGKIERFTAGQHDISDKFHIPQRLYGREQEVATLIGAFERVSQGQSEMMLVSGYAGIGKSALVNEIHKPIVQQRGYFISGKFDQLQSNIPYTALTQAFQDLIRQLLTESEAEIAAWKEKLLGALGSNGQVIIDVIPEVELIIGPQPSVLPARPIEAQNRFNRVWQNFISVFTAQKRPLVVFLDDLQWADSATLSLIQLLMVDPDSQYLFMVGAYRDNEVDSGHPLRLILDQIKEEGAKVSHITLGPLGMIHLNQLIADSLHCDAEISEPLAALVFEKTNGNPFFLLELLKTLYDEKLLMFNLNLERWQWNLAKIQEMEITENVVDLMADKIQKLAPQTQYVLKLAACIGNVFALETLSTVNEQSLTETATALWEGIQEGLILPVSDIELRLLDVEMESEINGNHAEILRCKFLHDRVQQVAYSLIGEDEKKAVHFKIGQLLRDETSQDAVALEEKIFDLVHQMNLGVNFLTTQIEKNELAQFNLMAGKKAKAATAYEAAGAYLTEGMGLLDQKNWYSHYELIFALHLERAECEYLVGNFDRAEELCDVLLKNATNTQDKEKVYNLKIALYTSLDKYSEALETGIEAAKLLGLNLSISPSQLDIGREFIKAKWYLRNKKTEDLMNLPAMTDPQQLAIMNLLLNLTSSAFLSNETFAILISLKLFNISLKYGNSQASPFGYMIYGVVNSGMGHFPQAYEFGKLALELNRKLDNVRLEHILNYLFADVINHPNRHVPTSMNYLVKAYQAALEAGDLYWADYSLMAMMSHSSFQGDTLDQVWAKCEQYLDFFKRVNGPNFIETLQGQTAVLHQQHILNLRGLTKAPNSLSDDDFDEDQHLTQLTEKNEFFFYYIFKLMTAFLCQHYMEALKAAIEVEKVIKAAMLIGEIRVPDFYFYYSLTLAALYSEATGKEKKRYLKTLKNNQKMLKKWANSCPENAQHKYLLVEAEMARVSGKDLQAMDLYDQAIVSASENEYLHNEAIANELAARFYLAKGKEKTARSYLSEVRYLYLKWGATRKVNALDEKYPQLSLQTLSETEPSGTTTTTTRISGSSQLDLDTVLKASQAISGEIQLAKLLETLMKTVIENAGAQKGTLILAKAGALVIEAEKGVNEADIAVLQSMPVEDSHRLPASIIQYVQRTQKPEVLDDATEEGMFTTDPYIVENRPKSILCTPLINQAKLIGILYLENNLTQGAFTPDRLEVLNLLSSQAAISIENASLYADLQSYSEELEEKNVALVRAHAIELDNIRKTEELERARELQLSMIPKTPPELPFLEIATHIETATEVGGDYFDFFPQDDGSLYLVVGDATGHGSAAGMMVSMTKTVLNSLDWLPPETMMGRLNGVMKRIQSKRSVQMALNISHIQSDAIRFSSAAMPPAFLFDSHTGKVEEIMVPGLPLGSGLRRMNYSVKQVRFNINDTFVLISDGLPEARNEEGTYLSYEAVKNCIRETGKSSAEDIKNALIALGENWLEGLPNEDDVTIVVVKRIQTG